MPTGAELPTNSLGGICGPTTAISEILREMQEIEELGLGNADWGVWIGEWGVAKEGVRRQESEDRRQEAEVRR
jgi:hypothetical protein